jgi:hypothetical protein
MLLHQIKGEPIVSKEAKISLLPWTQTTRIPIENLNEANIFAFPCL